MAEKTNPAGEPVIARLRAEVGGAVLVPGDPDFDKACTIYLGGLDERPAVVVRPDGVADVARVVAVARETGVALAVKGGGHSPFALCDGGIVLDMSTIRDLEIDPETRTAWAGAGLTAGEFTNAAHEHGLALGLGDTGSVGLGGITIGGGIGYLVRKYGLTIDHLLAAEIVTADGELRRVDAENEPDLFWAIRGGGGNFGVVTRLRYNLVELRTVVGGLLVQKATPETISGFVKLAQEAPAELTSIMNIFNAPPMPFVPDELVGTPIIMSMMVYAGEGEAAERALAPFRELDAPIADMIETMPLPGIYPPEDEDEHPIAASRNLFTDTVDLDDATLILDRIAAATADMAATQIRVINGAASAVPADATAYAHRDRDIMINLAAIYSDLADTDNQHRWVDEFTTALAKGKPAMYVNFLDNRREGRIREAYPDGTWERLRAIKRTYDPTNVFRVNNNIPPADA
ncbi:FAD-binding oxidoreductase [Actinokineospora sp. UTMC 2448]|uniref:FAD-binding oxidoreductase n=1 Tax=Actinokineospora sp. UTMC 2448 TaxID=2268449 RepID=UPI002164BB01|nr:FAD-binding oxidoreductase [Actinokineospora sp. UTMC 2448]